MYFCVLFNKRKINHFCIEKNQSKLHSFWSKYSLKSCLVQHRYYLSFRINLFSFVSAYLYKTKRMVVCLHATQISIHVHEFVGLH